MFVRYVPQCSTDVTIRQVNSFSVMQTSLGQDGKYGIIADFKNSDGYPREACVIHDDDILALFETHEQACKVLDEIYDDLAQGRTVFDFTYYHYKRLKDRITLNHQANKILKGRVIVVRDDHVVVKSGENLVVIPFDKFISMKFVNITQETPAQYMAHWENATVRFIVSSVTSDRSNDLYPIAYGDRIAALPLRRKHWFDKVAKGETKEFSLNVGKIVSATVLATDEKGIYIDCGGVEEFITISKEDKKRSPSDYKVGREIQIRLTGVTRKLGDTDSVHFTATPISLRNQDYDFD